MTFHVFYLHILQLLFIYEFAICLERSVPSTLAPCARAVRSRRRDAWSQSVSVSGSSKGVTAGHSACNHTLYSCVMHPFKRKDLGEILLCGVSLCCHCVPSSGGGSS